MRLIGRLAIQVAVFAALLGGAEIAARIAEPWLRGPEAAAIDLTVRPYMMFTTSFRARRSWHSSVTNETVPTTITFNNFGFAEGFDFSFPPDQDYVRAHRKQPGERLVLLTGGSAAAGIGASANDKTLAARLEAHLNDSGGGARYRVINLATASWSSYQQFIGLSLFGLPLDPDWIVVMDGANDSQVACPQGSGAGNTMEWPKFLYFTQYGGRTQLVPQTLLRHSALVRVITGQQPAPEPPQRLVFDDRDPDRRFDVKIAGLTMAEEDRQVDFYLHAQRNVVELFHRANVLFSTQPTLYDNAVAPSYRTAFRPGAAEDAHAKLATELGAYMAGAKDTACGVKVGPDALGYFMGRSALRLAQYAADAQTSDPARRILYYNTEAVFSLELKQREAYYLDNLHMTDAGQDRLGAFFAGAILSAEHGMPFDYAAFLQSAGGPHPTAH